MSFVENTEFLVDQQQWGHGKVYLHSICTAEFSDSNNGANNNVLLLHGAGHNTIVWTCCAKALALHGLRCFMYDFRHHGHTTIGELTHPVTLRGASASRLDMSMDMSMGTLVKDTAIVLQHIQQKYGQSKNGKIGLVGHSLGGAVAVRTAENHSHIVAWCAVVDLVEGTAIDSLPHLKAFLEQRPKTFPNSSAAFNWALQSGYIENIPQSLKSFPLQLRPLSSSDRKSIVETKTQTHKETQNNHIKQDRNVEINISNNDADCLDVLSSNKNADSFATHQLQSDDNAVEWRTDLLATEIFWKDWYTGLSLSFLGLEVPKLLILAGLDRLDTSLTIGQMNGRFQLALAAKGVGHNIPLIAPDWLCKVLQKFHYRHCKNTQQCQRGQGKSSTQKLPSMYTRLDTRAVTTSEYNTLTDASAWFPEPAIMPRKKKNHNGSLCKTQQGNVAAKKNLRRKPPAFNE